MSALEFVSSLVKSLAWPILVVVLAIAFRASLERLIGQLGEKIVKGLTKAKFPGGELDFDSGLSSAGAKIAEQDVIIAEQEQMRTSQDLPIQGSPVTRLRNELEQTALEDPREAVISGFVPVEDALRALMPHNININNRGVTELADLAVRAGTLDSDTAKIIRQLTDLRNVARFSQSADISPTQAINFLTLTDRVLLTLRNGKRATKEESAGQHGDKDSVAKP